MATEMGQQQDEAPRSPAGEKTMAAAGDSDEPAPSPATAEPATKPSPVAASKRTTPLLWLAILLYPPLLLVLGGFAAWFYLEPRLSASELARADVEQRTAALGQRLQALEAKVQPLAPRLDTIAGDLADVRTATMPMTQLAAKAADIEQRLLRLDQQLQQMAATHLKAEDLLERVQRLETQAVRAATLDRRLEALEASGAQAREALMQGSSIVLAAGQLARAVRDGTPFAAQLTTLKALAGRDERLAAAAAALEPFAASGVAPLAKLRAQFPAVALAVSREAGAREGEGWFDRVLHRLSTLITVRRVGPEAIEAGGTEGLLAAAEAALEAGDLAAAVDALGRLSGPEAVPASGWLAEAGARLAAEQALAQLEDRAIAYLSQVRG